MIKKFTIEKGQKPTKEQLREVAEAKKHPIVFDEDCPELSPAMMKAIKGFEPLTEEQILQQLEQAKNHADQSMTKPWEEVVKEMRKKV